MMDLQIWRNQIVTWNEIVDRGQNNIKAIIIVRTDIVSKIQGTVSATIVYPLIFKDKFINSPGFITLFNPSD